MDPSLPAQSRRLFAHYLDLQRLPDTAAEFVIARLCEEGDSQDLQWLTAKYSEHQLGDWLQTSGARQLSHRSRCFWEVVLGRCVSQSTESRGLLWPL